MVFGSKKTDDVEKSKVVTRGNAEGSGIYSCTAGSHADEPFTSTDKEEIAKHEREFKHYRQGSAPCAICHERVDMNVVLTRAGDEPQHDECRKPPEEL